MESGGGEAETTPRRSTGELRSATGALSEPKAAVRKGVFQLRIRIAELIVFLLAILGAIAFGLGISDYFGDHPYLSAYLIAFAGFLFADELVRDDGGIMGEASSSRRLNRIPILLLFAAAPFERTYIYGGEPAAWLCGLGLLIELLGLWLALGARVQWSYFSPGLNSAEATLVKSGFYRYLRHPVYAGTWLVLLAWPLEFGAPITLIIALAVGFFMVRRMIRNEEAAMLARFGAEYRTYRSTTDAIIPGVW